MVKAKSTSRQSALTAAVITVSDSAYRGRRTDQSGPAVCMRLAAAGFSIVGTEIVPDESAAIARSLIRWCRRAQLAVTTGGTGMAARDVTPEATQRVCRRLVPGIPERMRTQTGKRAPFAALSRAVCGIRGRSLVLNLPGSLKGASESLAAVIDLLPHALELLRGETEH
jgi:molybdenum cofactor synthesis domain-containing protein